MYLMYIDESGDTGIVNSPVRYFCLTGIIVHETKWRATLASLVELRTHFRLTKGLKLREEIHATEMLNKPGELVRIKRNDRLDILKQIVNWTAKQSELSVISVVVDKQGKSDDVFELAWKALIQRFENTLIHTNFPEGFEGNPSEHGMMIPDNTDGEKLRNLIRRMRHYNPIPSRLDQPNAGSYANYPMIQVIEDPFMKDSKLSLFHQVVDVIAYTLRQKFEPNGYMKKKGGHNWYSRLIPVICKHASPRTDCYIVNL